MRNVISSGHWKGDSGNNWRKETRQVDQFEICCNSAGVKYGGLNQVLTVRGRREHPYVWAFGAVSQLRPKSHLNKGNSVGCTGVEYVHVIRFSEASTIQERIKTSFHR